MARDLLERDRRAVLLEELVQHAAARVVDHGLDRRLDRGELSRASAGRGRSHWTTPNTTPAEPKTATTTSDEEQLPGEAAARRARRGGPCRRGSDVGVTPSASEARGGRREAGQARFAAGVATRRRAGRSAAPRRRCLGCRTAGPRRRDDASLDRTARRHDARAAARTPARAAPRRSCPRARCSSGCALCAREGRPLRVKQGFDPTAPDIHLGHTVGLRKLRQFQDLGHQVVLIVGDYTGMVGDPSGRSKTRPAARREAEVEANAAHLSRAVLPRARPRPAPPRLPVEVHRNGEWFSRMSFMDVHASWRRSTPWRACSSATTSRKRFAAQQPIGIHELLYPLMQGYDSVAIRADVELGATEQKFNLLVGRALQEIHGQPPQIVADAAGAAGARRRAADEQEPRQLHRRHRRAGARCSAR